MSFDLLLNYKYVLTTVCSTKPNITFSILSLWREVAVSNSSDTHTGSTAYNVGDKVSFVCDDESVPSRTFNITCIGTLGWDIPDPLPLCQAPRPTPDYVVVRNNGSFTGTVLQSAEVCDTELQLEVPLVKTRLDMFQILANVTRVANGVLVPVANNIRRYVNFLVHSEIGNVFALRQLKRILSDGIKPSKYRKWLNIKTNVGHSSELVALGTWRTKPHCWSSVRSPASEQ